MTEKDYSATPLPRKLGIKEGHHVALVNEPQPFRKALRPLPDGVEIGSGSRGGSLDVAVLFVTHLTELRKRFPSLARAVFPDGGLWIAWPKVASKIDTDLDFDAVQELGLAAGLVDNKSASLTDAYQGLRFVYRLTDR